LASLLLHQNRYQQALLKDIQLEHNIEEMTSWNAPGNTFFKD